MCGWWASNNKQLEFKCLALWSFPNKKKKKTLAISINCIISVKK